MKTKTTEPSARGSPLHDLTDPWPDSAGVQVSVVVGAPAEDAFLISAGNPAARSACCRPALSWVYLFLSQVTWIVPSLSLSTVNAAVWM